MRLIQLGRHLRGLGSLTLLDFEAHVRSLQQYRTIAFITILESQLQMYGASPGFWAEDVRRMIERMSKATTAEDYMVPRDLRDGHDAEEARRLSSGAGGEVWRASGSVADDRRGGQASSR